MVVNCVGCNESHKRPGLPHGAFLCVKCRDNNPAKPTADEWIASGNTVYSIGTKDRGSIAVCGLRTGTHVPADQNEANAKLVAAAPDLLAALKLAKQHCVNLYDGGNRDVFMASSPMPEILAAIAKAEGKQ